MWVCWKDMMMLRCKCFLEKRVCDFIIQVLAFPRSKAVAYRWSIKRKQLDKCVTMLLDNQVDNKIDVKFI
jgi:hypothetical protein